MTENNYKNRKNHTCATDDAHSAEWSVSKELAKCNRRLFVIILIMAFLWFSSIPITAGIASGDFGYMAKELKHQTDKQENSDYEEHLMQKFFNDEWELFITHCGFTDAELEVVALLRRGWYEADIAEEISASRSTVKRRKKSIALKISHYLVSQA